MATRARHRASRPVTTGANTRTRAHARRCCDTLAALSEPWLASANAKRSLLGHEPSMLAAASKRHDTTPLPTTNKLSLSLSLHSGGLRERLRRSHYHYHTREARRDAVCQCWSAAADVVAAATAFMAFETPPLLVSRVGIRAAPRL